MPNVSKPGNITVATKAVEDSMKTELASPSEAPSTRSVGPSAQDQQSASHAASSDVGVDRLGGSRMNRIAQRAHEIYQRRGGEHGRALDDWLQAEREIDDEIDASRGQV